MRTNSTIEDEDDFEDAVELTSPCRSIPPPPVNNLGFVNPNTLMGTPERPAALNVAPEWSRSTNVRGRQRLSQTSLNTPRTSSQNICTPGMQSSRDSAHRDRIANLRRRMNVEFGNRELGPSGILDYEIDDAMSTMSEAPSLQSWHQRIITRNDTLVVNASDSLSTCAMSIPASTVSETFEHFKSPQPPQGKPNLQGQVWSSIDQASTSSSISPRPRIQPPPVPSRDHVTPSKSSINRIPPPLPPRKSVSKLPDPIALEVENRLKIEEEITENGSPFVPSSLKDSQAKTSKSNDSIVTVSEYRKNHKKTSSLDRSLPISKSVKNGQFPLPSNKSNSISRQEINSKEEEEERNALAEGVIKKITESVENAHISKAEIKLETISSAVNSSISSPCSSTDSKQELPIDGEEPCSSNTVANLECISQPVAAKIDESRTSRSQSNDELKNRSEQLSSSFDPIALDVERRLSMKRIGQAHDDEPTSLSDDNTSRLSVAKSGIGHATSFARNSVRYASGMIRGAFRKVKSAKNNGANTTRSGIGGDSTDDDETDSNHPLQGNIVRPRKSKKGPFDFENLIVEQDLDNEHTGAVWCIKFSICGRLMATAGQDSILRIWVVKSHLKYFSEMREKYSSNIDPEKESMMDNVEQFRPPSSMESGNNSETLSEEDSSTLFCVKPFALLKGHTADILDLSWSKNYFILSSGMDRTVKLWHLSRNECLCCFQHIDFVTCVAFLPKDDRYFLSGSLDGKLRMWHIPDKKVAVWNEVQVKFITAITFVKNGRFAVVGTYNGRCYFYTTDHLKYHTVVDVRSTRGKNAKGHKVTGLAAHGDKLLVTSNDSRIRMYDIRDKALTCKFKGVQNDHSQIRAAFSPDGRHIICGSEDKFVYLWRTCDMPSSLSVRKDRNSMWERIRTHTAPVAVAVFAPRPHVFFSMLEKREKKLKTDSLEFGNMKQSDSITSNGNVTIPGHVIVSADLQGVIKVMVNRPKQCKVAPPGFSKSTRSSTS